MATFEYKCNKCESILSEVTNVRFRTDGPCEEKDCMGTYDNFISSVPPVHFKGSGWPDKAHRKNSTKRGK